MIELRWLERPAKAPIDAAHGEVERVLQYRDAHWNEYIRATGEPVYTGTDWKDVPTVTL